MTKERLKQLAKEYLPDEETCDIMPLEELNQQLADRRRQLVDFVEFVEKKTGIFDSDDEPYFGWCDVKGCPHGGACGGTGWRETGYWTLCSQHSRDARDGKPQPEMKPEAIAKEASRDPVTGYLPI